MDDMNNLLKSYRQNIHDLIKEKSVHPIFPTAQPCVTVAIDEVFRAARKEMSLIVNSFSADSIIQAIQNGTYENIQKLSKTSVKCLLVGDLSDAFEVLRSKGFAVRNVSNEVLSIVRDVSFLLVDDSTLVIFSATNPRVVLIPCAPSHIVESCIRLVKELQEAVGAEATETPDGGSVK